MDVLRAHGEFFILHVFFSLFLNPLPHQPFTSFFFLNSWNLLPILSALFIFTGVGTGLVGIVIEVYYGNQHFWNGDVGGLFWPLFFIVGLIPLCAAIFVQRKFMASSCSHFRFSLFPFVLFL